jgi:putative membrane protein
LAILASFARNQFWFCLEEEASMSFLINWLLSGLAIVISAYLLPGVKLAGGFKAALLTALVLGLINAFIKPVLSLLTLPLTILTLGLFSLVLNALLIMLVTKIVPGFQVQGFLWAVAFSIVLTLVNWVMSIFKQ